MADKKLTIGLPIAFVLGGSALAFGVVPGVRDWVDQTVPWLGINGPKSLAQTTKGPAATGLKAEGVKAERVPMAGNVTPSEAALPNEIEANKPNFPVQYAAAAEPIATEPPIKNQDDSPTVSPFLRTTPASSQLPTLPVTGLNVPSSENGVLLIKSAQVTFPDDITVSATAEGTILKLLVDDGTVIEAGMPMIEIDSRLAEKEVVVSEKELKAASLKANDDSNVKYSEAAKEVAMQDVEISKELLKSRAEGIMEGRKKELELKKASLQVTVSTIEKERDQADVGVKTAKLEAAKVQLDLRRISAQRTGVVNQVVKRQYAYVRAGEPILNLTSMEKIRITGTTPNLSESPHLLLNAPARVIINYAVGRSETVDGTVTYVSPKSDGPNQYKLHVDLPNRLTPDGQYLFRDGMVADIEVRPRSR
jgi:multidrug efflux pump subunit AcrA (membrane-fusion protein)